MTAKPHSRVSTLASAARLEARAWMPSQALSAALLLMAVCVSALTAHMVIDAAGDFVLRHDTYDDVAHASRIWAVLAAVGLLSAGGFVLLWSSLESALLDHTRATRISGVRLGFVRHPVWIGVAVLVLSIAAVMGMECVDVLLSGHAVSGVSQALGGSAWLGLSVTSLCALLSAAGALRFARSIDRARAVLVRAFAALVIQWRIRPLKVAPCAAPERRFLYRPLTVYLGRAHKRGPPVAR